MSLISPQPRLYIDTLFGNVTQTLSLGANNTVEFRTIYSQPKRELLATASSFIETQVQPDFSFAARSFREAIMRGEVLQTGQVLTAQSVWEAFKPASEFGPPGFKLIPF